MEKNLQEAKHVATPISAEGVVIDGPGFGKIRFDDGAVTYYRKAKRWIKFQSYLKGSVFTPTARAINANTITYQGGKFVAVNYQFFGDDYKETITLKDLPQSQRINLSDISFYVTCSEGTHIEQQPSGELYLMRTAFGDTPERCLMVIPVPTAIDAESTVYPISWSYNESTQFLTINGSLAGAVYPVTIDPSVNLDTAADSNATRGHRNVARDEAGRIWACWIDDLDAEVAYSDDNGATFDNEEPWTSKYTVYGTSICVDGNRNVHLVINYFDTSTYNIIYYKRTHSSSTWDSSPTTLSTNGAEFEASAIFVDSNNYVYVVSGTPTSLRISQYTTSWQTEIVKNTQTMTQWRGFALDKDGTVHFLYIKSSDTPDKLYHISYTTSWSTEIVVTEDATYDINYPALAADSNGNLHAAYYRNGGAYYKKRTGSTWGSEETVAASVGFKHLTISLTRSNAPIVTAIHSSTSYPANYCKDGAGWSLRSPLSLTSDNVTNLCAYFPNCPTDNQSNIPIDGVLQMVTHYTGSKYYAVFSQASEFQPANTCETIYSCQLGTNVGSAVSLSTSLGRQICRDSAGRIWVAYKTSTTALRARYSDNEGRTWTEETISLTGGTVVSLSIAVDADRNVHLAFDNSSTDIKYRKRTHASSTWESEETVATEACSNPAIAVDSSGYPHVVWAAANNIKYRYKTSGGWQSTETVASTTAFSYLYTPCIVIDSNGYVYVSYTDYTAFIYSIQTAKRTTSWSNLSAIGPTTSQTTPQYARLALSPTSGAVWAVAQRGGLVGSSVTDVYYCAATSWIDTDFMGSVNNDSVPTISVDMFGTVHVTYTKIDEGAYYVKKTSSGSWTSETTVFTPPEYGSVLGTSSVLDNSGTGVLAVYCAETISTTLLDIYIWKSSDLYFPIHKSLTYAITAAGPQPHSFTKDLKYCIPTTKTPITKNLTYTIKITPIATTKQLDYKITSVLGTTKSLVYTIQSIPLATTKSLAYTIKGTLGTTKSLTYVVTRTTSITKDLQYLIEATSTPVTKSLQYTVKTTITLVTKNLSYAIVKTVELTDKNLQYNIKSTPTANTKGLSYAIWWVPVATDKTLQYAILYTVPTTKNLAYNISTTQSYQIQKDLTYTVVTTGTVGSKQLTYCILVTCTLTKGLTYAISGTVPVITRSLTYAILRSGASTKGLTYVIQFTSLFTKDLQYVISTTEAKQIQLDLQYKILSTASVITKSLSYSILKAQSITKLLVYTIQSTKSFQINLAYNVSCIQSTTRLLTYAVICSLSFTRNLTYVLGGVSFTRSLTYTIITVKSATRDLSYSILRTYPVTQSLTYSILKSRSTTLSLSYAIKSTTPIDRSLAYYVVTTKSTQLPLAYSISVTGSSTKQLTYVIYSTHSTTLNLAYQIAGVIVETIYLPLTYTIPTVHTEQRILTYSIERTGVVQKNLTYSIQSTTYQQLVLAYTVKSTVPIVKDLSYTIRTSNLIDKSLSYTITSIIAVTKQLVYTVQISEVIQKGLAYSIPGQTFIQISLTYTIRSSYTITRQLTYSVVITKSTTLDLAYEVIPAAPILTQVDLCIKVDWVVT